MRYAMAMLLAAACVPAERDRVDFKEGLDGPWPDMTGLKPVTFGRPVRRSIGGSALAVACPRCKAPPGQPCDPRTLGRHPFHMARVKAVKR